MTLEDEIARIFRRNVGRSVAAPTVERDAPPPARLPRLRGVPGIYIEDENTAIFVLENEAGEKVHLPVDGHSLPQLADLIRYVLQVAPEHETAKAPATDLVPAKEAVGW